MFVVCVASGLDLKFSRGSDPEPWRCKRTDGKKWRCTRDVAPDQKYCERHAHKSKPRSRKPVEIHNTNNNNNNSNNRHPPTPTSRNHHHSFQFPTVQLSDQTRWVVFSNIFPLNITFQFSMFIHVTILKFRMWVFY